MPELPEVETVRRGLARLIVGRTVRSAKEFDSPKSFPNAPADVTQFLVGAKVIQVRRRAKVLLIELSSKYTLVIHLKMTGQLVWVDRDPQTKSSGTASRLTSLEHASGSDRAADVPDNLSEAPDRFGAGHPNDSLIGELPDRSTRVMIEFTDDSKLFFNDQRKFGWMKL